MKSSSFGDFSSADVGVVFETLMSSALRLMAESAGEGDFSCLRGRRATVCSGSSARPDSDVGMSAIFNCKALYASLSGTLTVSYVKVFAGLNAIQHPPPQHFSINCVPASPMSFCMSVAFCEINMVLARRGRGGSSGSSRSSDEEYVKEGAVDLAGEGMLGSRGIQCVVVLNRIGNGRDILDGEAVQAERRIKAVLDSRIYGERVNVRR